MIQNYEERVKSMATITFQGNPVETIGSLPPVGRKAPAFTLTRTDLSDVTLSDYAGKRIVMNIFPSIDTPVCAITVHHFNDEAAKLDNVVILCISADLPFAQQRYCAAEGLENVIPLSLFRWPAFGKDYGVTISGGPLAGLMSRAVVIIDESGTVIYTQQVPEIADEPDYDAALAVLKK